jgi:hypothetical protein
VVFSSDKANCGIKMGRKIKGKKHHGTKDPEKQQQRRMEKIKLKVITIFFLNYYCWRLDPL